MKDSCIVHNYLFDGQGGGREVGDDYPQDGNLILWTHIEYKHPQAVSWLESQGLDPLVAETLTRVESRPRALSIDNGIIIILRAINLNPGEDVEDMVSLRIWISGNRIITLRQRRVVSIQDVRQALDKDMGPSTGGEFLVMVVERIADRIGETIDDIEEKLSVYEDTAENNDSSIRGRVGAMRRKTAAIRRFLAPQREALDAVHRLSKDLLNESEMYCLRDQTDRMTRYVEELDLARERTLVLQEDIMNRIAQEQNSRTYLFSIVATIFLPLSFLTGVFGMNVAGLPGTEDGQAFLYLSCSMLGIAIGLIIYMRLRRWL